MDCIGVRENINAYIDGELSEVEAKLVESHLTACDSCRHEREAYELTRSFVSSAGPVPSPAGLSESIRVMMEKERLIPKRKAFTITRATGSLIAASFAVAIVAGAVSLRIINFDHAPVAENVASIQTAAPASNHDKYIENVNTSTEQPAPATAKVIINPARDDDQPSPGDFRMKRAATITADAKPVPAHEPAAPRAPVMTAEKADTDDRRAPAATIAMAAPAPAAAPAMPVRVADEGRASGYTAPATPSAPPRAVRPKQPSGGSAVVLKLPAMPADAMGTMGRSRSISGTSEMVSYTEYHAGMTSALAMTSNTGPRAEDLFAEARPGRGAGVETAAAAAPTADTYSTITTAGSFTYFPTKDKKESANAKGSKPAKPPLKMTVKVKSKDPVAARKAALAKLPKGSATEKDGKLVLKQPADTTLASLKSIKTGTAGQAKMTVPEAMLNNEARDPQPRTVETEVIFVSDEE